jgi:hypothetical protein
MIDTVELGGEVTAASLLGGAHGPATGGIDVDFANAIDTPGTLQASYSTPTNAAFLNAYSTTAGFALTNFSDMGPSLQLWELDYSEQIAAGEPISLSFKYDDSSLATPENFLGMWHFGRYGLNGSRKWKWVPGIVDATNNIITISVDHFSPFALGFEGAPEPTADFNFDGIVDAADYVAWRMTNSGNAQGYADWVNNFGDPTSGSGGGSSTNGFASAPAVPEPTTALLMLFAVAGVFTRRHDFE